VPPPIAPQEIWVINVRDATGTEQRGTHPGLVLAVHNQTRLAVVVPMTSNADASRFPYTYTIPSSPQNSLRTDSVAMIFQIRALSFDRFGSRIGRLEQSHFQTVKMTTKQYLNL
jgi:mRNA interferase MazF